MEKLLHIIADQNFHSGSQLGKQLGMSRAGVWKHIQKLQSMGVEIESIKGKGYRLTVPIELLHIDAIHTFLSPQVKKDTRISIKSVTDSTNDDLMRCWEGTSNTMPVCLAEYQTHARGRQGKAWYSPYGSNIYLSMGFHLEDGVLALEGLSLVVGLTVIRALEQLGYAGISLKWPNDVLYQGKKLAGILVEIRGEYTRQCQVIIGIGLNISLPESNIIDQAAVSLQHIKPHQYSKNQIAAELINGLHRDWVLFRQNGFTYFRDGWQAYDALLGKSIVILAHDQRYQGVGLGTDPTGGYRVQLHQGEEYVCRGGEISLRL